MQKYSAESARLWLQPLCIEEHLDDCHAIMSDARALRWSTRTPAQNIEETRAMMLTRIPSPEKPWIENYAILLRPSQSSETQGKPRMIGTVGAPRVSEQLDAAEIGYGLHPDFWGSGYMPEALGLFIGLYWAPERQGTRNTIIAEIDPENRASERIVEKLGFRKGTTGKDITSVGTYIALRANQHNGTANRALESALRRFSSYFK